MAYMNQEKKAKIASALKTVMAGTGFKYSLRVRNYSTLVLTIQSAPVDLVAEIVKNLPNYKDNKGHIDINQYCPEKYFSGELLELFKKIIDTMNLMNYDNSDIQSDYFDVGHYIDIQIGTWEKPFKVVTK